MDLTLEFGQRARDWAGRHQCTGWIRLLLIHWLHGWINCIECNHTIRDTMDRTDSPTSFATATSQRGLGGCASSRVWRVSDWGPHLPGPRKDRVHLHLCRDSAWRVLQPRCSAACTAQRLIDLRKMLVTRFSNYCTIQPQIAVKIDIQTTVTCRLTCPSVNWLSVDSTRDWITSA